MQHQLHIYAAVDADHAEIVYFSNEAFGGFAVGDVILPLWRIDEDRPEDYYPGNVLRVVRVERGIEGRSSSKETPYVATRDLMHLYCKEEPRPRPGNDE